MVQTAATAIGRPSVYRLGSEKCRDHRGVGRDCPEVASNDVNPSGPLTGFMIEATGV